MANNSSNTREIQQEIRKILNLAQSTDHQNHCREALLIFCRTYPNISLDILRYESSGDTILHCAARYGNLSACIYLLEHFSPDCRNKDNKTPLHEAAQFGQAAIAQHLLQAGAHVDALKKADWTPLMLACTKFKDLDLPSIQNRHDLVDILLSKGANVNFQNKDGWNSLHLATREGDTLLIQKLCHNGADVRRRTKNGNTCLHIAALHQHTDAFRLLFNMAEEMLEWQSNHGNYPLHEAVLSKDLAMFKCVANFYLQQGINLQILNNKIGYNAMHLAAFIGVSDIVQACLEDYQFDINCTTNDLQNCLHLASQNKMWQVYKVCIDSGLDSNISDKFGRTPCDYNVYNK